MPIGITSFPHAVRRLTPAVSRRPHPQTSAWAHAAAGGGRLQCVVRGGRDRRWGHRAPAPRAPDRAPPVTEARPERLPRSPPRPTAARGDDPLSTIRRAGHRTYNYAAPSGLRDRKAPKDGQQPCFTPKGRCHLSQSLMAATVRLARSWEDLYRHRPLFTLFYRRHPHQKIETAPPWSYCCRGGLSLFCGCSSSLWTPNAKSISERLRQPSHIVRPNPQRTACGSDEPYMLFQDIVGPCRR
jgi:hypothetical protein